MSEGLTDSHCHLDHFSHDEMAEMVGRAAEAGVRRMVTIGVRMAQADAVKAITERFPMVWGTVGVHPHNAGEGPAPLVEEIVALADHPKVIGIGESGLDHFYDKAPRGAQAESFRRHIRAARAAGLPLVIHARDADADIAAILAEEREAGGPFDAVLHCFSSGRALAEAVVEAGGYVSFSGILTFKGAEAIREIARNLPQDRILVETDAPYLAPMPLRGKRNEPAYVGHTAAVLGAVRGWEPETTADITTANFLRLFRKCV